MTAKYPTGKVLTYYALFGGGIGGLIHLIGVMLFPMNETISRHSWQHVGLNNFYLAMLGAIAFGTLFGFIPSIVTSIIIVLRKIVLSSVWQYFRLFVIGCFVTFFIFVIAFHDIDRLFTSNTLVTWLGILVFNGRLAIVGGLSSVIVGKLVLPKS